MSEPKDMNVVDGNDNDNVTTAVSTTTSNPTATLSSTSTTHRSNNHITSSPIVVNDSNHSVTTNNNNSNSNNVTSQSAVAVAVMNSDVVVTPSAHSTPNNNINNTSSISTTTKSPFTLPNGEIMNSKNTLQSFVVVPTAAVSDTTNNNNNNNNITKPPSVPDLQPQQQHDLFRLPNGEMMDSKNTLQSFAAAVVPPPPPENHNSTIHQHHQQYNDYRLPNGEIINAKNINRSYENEYRNYDVDVEGRGDEELDTNDNHLHHNDHHVIQAVAVDSFVTPPATAPTAIVVEAEAVDSLLRREDQQRQMKRKRVFYGVAILMVLVGTISVAAGYCGAGQCSSQPKDGVEKVQVPPESMGEDTPILKVDTITSYINNITLSNRIIRSTGTLAEDAALRWLINDDPIFNDTDVWSSLILYPNATAETAAHIRIRQRYSLLTLWFQQLNDDGIFEPTWTNTTGWLNDTNECHWYGITCDSSLIVIGIDFQGNDKVITVPPEDILPPADLFNSEDLTTGNNFTGTMPMDIGLLSNLRKVNLRNSGVTGLLPSTVGRWTSLEHFSVGTEQKILEFPFKYRPKQLIGTLPTTIGFWSRLEYFSARNSKFTGAMPSSIVAWTSLQYFDVHGNEFAGALPLEINRWIGMTHFDLSKNLFRNLAVGNNGNNWTYLQHYDISGNGLRGLLSDTMGKWNLLTYCNISGNDLSGSLPSVVGRWTDLAYFDSHDNRISGQLPSTIGQWTHLTYFDFASNKLYGTLPSEIGQWTK